MRILLLKTNIQKTNASVFTQILKRYKGVYYLPGQEGDGIILTGPQVVDGDQIQKDLDTLLKGINKDFAVLSMQEFVFVPKRAISLYDILDREFKKANFGADTPDAKFASICQHRADNIEQRYARQIQRNNQSLANQILETRYTQVSPLPSQPLPFSGIHPSNGESVQSMARRALGVGVSSPLDDMRSNVHSFGNTSSHCAEPKNPWDEFRNMGANDMSGSGMNDPFSGIHPFNGGSVQNMARRALGIGGSNPFDDMSSNVHSFGNTSSHYAEPKNPWDEFRNIGANGMSGSGMNDPFKHMDEQRKRVEAQNARLEQERLLEQKKAAEREKEFFRELAEEQRKKQQLNLQMLQEREEKNRLAQQQNETVERLTSQMEDTNQQLALWKNLELERNLFAYFEVNEMPELKSEEAKQEAFLDRFKSKTVVEIKENHEKDGAKIFFDRQQQFFTDQTEKMFKDTELFLQALCEEVLLEEKISSTLEHTQNGFCLHLAVTVKEESRESFLRDLQQTLILEGLESLYSVNKVTYLVPVVANTATNHPSPLGNLTVTPLAGAPRPTNSGADAIKLDAKQEQHKNEVCAKYKFKTETVNPAPDVACRRATAKGNLEDVKFFIEVVKVDPKLTSSNGMTALHWAHAHKHTDIINYLKGILGDTSALLDQEGRTPEQCDGVKLRA